MKKWQRSKLTLWDYNGEISVVKKHHRLALAKFLKPNGVLVFCEPLNEIEKIGVIKHLVEQNKLFLKDNRITHIPIMGNALERVYIKTNGGLQ